MKTRNFLVLAALALLALWMLGRPLPAQADLEDEYVLISLDVHRTEDMAWGDWDSDGDLDLAIANWNAPNYVYENVDGTLNLDPANGLGWESPDSRNTVSVAWGDWDGDGDLDLAFGNDSNQANQVYENVGGTLQLAWQSAEALKTKNVAWGDWDGDGDLDLAVANRGTGSNIVQVYENAGGTLRLGGGYGWSVGTGAGGVAWGDWDDDGDLDLAVGRYYATNRVYENDGGTMTLAWQSVEDNRTRGIAWGDWDGDGDLDLAVANQWGEPARVYQNDGGTMSLGWESADTSYIWDVAWGDWDSDDDLDLAVSAYDRGAWVYEDISSTLHLDPANGLGWEVPLYVDTYCVAWGDVDGDGDLDLAIGNDGVNVLFFNDGGTLVSDPTGGFGWEETSISSTLSVAWADWDSDGDLDLAIGNDGQTNQVYENDGSTLVLDPTGGLGWESAEISSTTSLAWGDWDGDGDLDLAVGNEGYPGEANQVYENVSGTLMLDPGAGLGWESAEISRTTSLAWGDWDGDGDLDLAVGNNVGQPNQVYENISDTLQLVWESAGLNDTITLAWGDWDGDDDLDLAVGNDGQPNQVYENEGGTLQLAWQSGLAFTSVSVAWGDWDGDGDLDLAVGNGADFGGPDQVYENTGGTLVLDPANGLGWQSAEAYGSYTLAWGDWDGDGDLDLVGDSIVHENEAGTFKTHLLDVYQDARMAWGDWDGDGDLDLALVRDGFPKLVLENRQQDESRLPNTLPGLAITHPGQTAAAAFHASPEILGDPVIPVSYTVFAPSGDTLGQLEAAYSFIGGGEWFSTTASGTPPPTTTAGSALRFDGVDDYVTVPNSLDINLATQGQRTIMAWFKATAPAITTTRQVIYEEGGVSAGLNLYLYDGRLYAGGWDENNGWSGTYLSSTTAISAGQWYHAALVLSGTSVLTDGAFSLYLDGQWVGSGAGVELLVHSGGIGIGVANDDTQFHDGDLVGNGGWFSGTIDEIQIWNAALDQAALQGNRYGTFKGGTTGLVAYWPFNEGSGNVTRDRAPDGIVDDDATLGGGTAWERGLFASYTYFWDTFASGFFGHSDSVVLRFWTNLQTPASPLTGTYAYPNHAPGPYQRPYISAQTFPFRVRGTQVRVISDTQPVEGAIVYRLPVSQTSGAEPMADDIGEPFRTDIQGYLRGRGRLAMGDRLVALLPVMVPHCTLYASTDVPKLIDPTLPSVVTSTLTVSDSGIVVDVNVVNLSGAHTYFEDLSFQLESPVGTSVVLMDEVCDPGVTVMGLNLDDEAAEPIPLDCSFPYAGTYQPQQPLSTFDGENSAGIWTLVITDSYNLDGGSLDGWGLEICTATGPDNGNEAYTLYHASAAPTETGLDAHIVTEPGVQTLIISPANPLLLFHLDISLEWDARSDDRYLTQLQYDLQRTSALLYDWSNGQIALGNTTIYHDREHWNGADVRIYASNRLRPNAIKGGIVSDVFSDTLIPSLTYHPGQVNMAPTWNRYGDAGGSFSEDWPRTLAHELGHYALFLDDNYLGLDEGGLLVPLSSCSGAMTDPYREDYPYGEFHADDLAWQQTCTRTISHQTTGRPDWTTIEAFYPFLNGAITNTGPAGLPLAVTQIRFVEPASPASALDDPTFYLVQGGAQVQPGPQARAFLFQGTGGPAGRLTDLGRPFLNQLLARGARVGDRLCLYEPSAGRLGCETISVSDRELELQTLPDWQPDLILAPISSRTLALTATNVPAGLALSARLYPASGPAEPAVPLAEVAGSYVATLSSTQDIRAAHVQLWVDEPDPRREIVTDYALGGSPGAGQFGWPARRPTSDPGLSALGVSADGQILLLGNLPFAADDFIALQTATDLPTPPPWLTRVGQPYRLLATPNAPDLDGASLSFLYLGREVPDGEESWLRIYFWDSATWQRLPTTLDTTYNIASAPCQGVGLYALFASIEIPLQQGWNLLAYPVLETRPVTETLLSIEGAYALVYGYDPPAADPWSLYGPIAPAWVNDLDAFQFGRGYWISATEAITLYLKGGTDEGLHSGFPNPPATYYGQILPGPDFTPTAGLTLTAWIEGSLCGQAQTMDLSGQIVYVLSVAADDEVTGCGAPGRQVRFLLDPQVMAPITAWNNGRLWPLAMQPDAPPIAVDDNTTTPEDVPIAVDVLANDIDPEGNPLTVAALGSPTHGTATLSDTLVLYTPASDYYGEDTFSYTASDGWLTATAMVSVVVTPVNDQPLALDDAVTTPEDTATVIDVLNNDSDVDGDVLVVSSIGTPDHGTALISGTLVVYTPSSGYYGYDSFDYVISDGALSDTAMVWITITFAANHPPEANDDSASTVEDCPVVIDALANDSDVDPGDILAIAALGAPSHGQAQLSGTVVLYTPTLNYFGADTFTYTISDGSLFDSAVVTVTISPLNDPPQAVGDLAHTDEDTAVNIDVLANDSDPDGDGLALAAVATPLQGTAVISGSTVLYMPAPDYYGSDTFTYTVSDGALFDAAAVSVTITPVADPPQAADDAALTAEDTPVSVDVLANDSDPDGDTLALVALGQPAHGSAAISGTLVLYTPTLDYYGLDLLTYTVSDGSLEATGMVSLTVTAVNDRPTISDIADQSTSPGTPLGPVIFTIGDVDDLAGTLDLTAHSSNPALVPDGSIAFGGAGITRTLFILPTLDLVGTAVITITVSDGYDSASDTFVLTVERTAFSIYLPIVLKESGP